MLIPLSIETPSMLNPEIIIAIPFLMLYSFIASAIPLIINLLLVNYYSSKGKLVYIIGTITNLALTNIILSFLFSENPLEFIITLYFAIPYALVFIVIITVKKFKIKEY